jgi:cytochrome c556
MRQALLTDSRRRRAATVVVAVLLVAGCAPTGTESLAAPGWTGLTDPESVIRARAELMEHMEELMEPIDTLSIGTGPVEDVPRLHQSAEMIGAMLGAVPHLFPPTTNLYDPSKYVPETLALPRIWSDFDTFRRLADAAAAAAERFAVTEGDGPLRDASRSLRGSCDGCHELFLRKYQSPVVLESDHNFDFESALP